ncbi:hypothetical protein MA16_Dca011041 [Dendrobium catenatum]|uniref:Uncharacterized protein n=1 Tax=Dendrobium catenatum TaxID=906689 RepID=A0A2I0WCG2_9ASPA|nr:hypothetical protein MA16_Dca011041 [Dendrobium catenatum]
MQPGAILNFSSKFFVDYCRWNGQYIKFKKSMILFCKVVSKRRRRRFNKELGLRNVYKITYLGVNIGLRIIKAYDIQFILDKAMHTLNTWASRLLSLA